MAQEIDRDKTVTKLSLAFWLIDPKCWLDAVIRALIIAGLLSAYMAGKVVFGKAAISYDAGYDSDPLPIPGKHKG